ncbi:hypothetical protein SAMN05421823_107118 [Catalinimonas alkaloidigena]|uniref:Uncharacterized protein n=1 Tax=Catalinimonas alkaloidigena TaxID=1075417 RepID=A0A1G9LPN2_9BACT|nr:hypothetical protein SAMN05421823_107118 [Catalinimonas alkaloidigena]
MENEKVQAPERQRSRERNTIKDYFALGDLFGYFFRVFRKPDPNHKPNFNLRMMHGINKISIIMFLFALIVMIVRFISRM